MPPQGWTVVPEPAPAPAGWTRVQEPTFHATNATDDQGNPIVNAASHLWDAATTPLIPKIAEAAHAIAAHIDAPALDRSRLVAQIRGFFAGATQGAGDVAAGFTSPVGIALTVAGLGSESAVVRNIPALQALLRLPQVQALQRAVQATGGAGFMAHGAARALNSDDAVGRLQGVAEVAAGALGATSAVRAASRGPVAAVPALTRLTPEEAASNAFAAQHGVPLDAATATGSPTALAAQKRVANSMGGETTASTLLRSQQDALTRVGSGLADEANANAGAQTPVSAGQSVQASVDAAIRSAHRTASAAYTRVRQLEQERASYPVRDLTSEQGRDTSVGDGSPGGVAGDVSSLSAGGTPSPRTAVRAAVAQLGPTPSESSLARLYFDDAKRAGFTGTLDDFRPLFRERLADAREIHADLVNVHAETGPEALLREIARGGGIGLDAGFPGEIRLLWEEAERFNRAGKSRGGALGRGKTSQFTTGNVKGVPNVLRRQGGLTLDGMAEYLRQDPRFEHVQTPQDVLDAVYEALSAHGKTPTMAEALESVGVRPGSKWWESSADADAFDPDMLERDSTGAAPGDRKIVPVDLSAFKAAMAPIYEARLRAAQLSPPMGADARFLQSLDRIMRGPNVDSLSVVDSALGDLKSLARGADMPELRNRAQGGAARAVDALDKQVRTAAAQAGPDLLEALETGRAATRRKYTIAGVRDLLSGEPGQVFRQLTANKDVALNRLEAVQAVAPETIPHVARAFLEDMLTTAGERGRFDHADKLFATWQRLGPESKRLLFPDADLRGRLDNFFLLAKRLAANPNPSGTAHVNSVFNLVSQPGYWAIAKLLYTPAGVRALTKVLASRPPASTASLSAAARVAGWADVVAAGKAIGVAIPVPQAADTQTEARR